MSAAVLTLHRRTTPDNPMERALVDALDVIRRDDAELITLIMTKRDGGVVQTTLSRADAFSGPVGM